LIEIVLPTLLIIKTN